MSSPSDPVFAREAWLPTGSGPRGAVSTRFLADSETQTGGADSGENLRRVTPLRQTCGVVLV